MIEGLRRGRPAFLASVTSAGEAELALESGADIIDCKDPKAGALGALAIETVREIVAKIAAHAPTSATIGDLPAGDPHPMVEAATAMADTGVTFVKVGFFGEADPRRAVSALGERVSQALLVAVLMADRALDLTLLPQLASGGFAGVMLDTADKSRGRLTTVLSMDRLAAFVRAARANGLFAGLAGSLSADDIAGLARLGPDVLGFRGALCAAGRESVLVRERVAAVGREIDRMREVRGAPERSVA